MNIGDINFDDLPLIRKGGPSLTMGGGESYLEAAKSTAEWEEKAAALRTLFTSTLGINPKEIFPLDIQVHGEEYLDGYNLRKLSYNAGANERINAAMLIPANHPGRGPAVLCLHQTTEFGREQVIGNDPSEAGQLLCYARDLAKLGFVTFAFDLTGANERRAPGTRAFDTADFYRHYPEWSARGKDLHDVKIALDVMQTMPEIDPGRIGCMGHSQGGGITVHAMGLDSRIKAGVSNCGWWPERLSKNPYNAARTGWWIGRPLLRPYCLTGKEFPTQAQEELAMAAPRPLLNITSLYDYQYGEDEAELKALEKAFANLRDNVKKVYALYGKENQFELITHREGHCFLPHHHERAYSFLQQFL